MEKEAEQDFELAVTIRETGINFLGWVFWSGMALMALCLVLPALAHAAGLLGGAALAALASLGLTYILAQIECLAAGDLFFAHRLRLGVFGLLILLAVLSFALLAGGVLMLIATI